MALAGADQAYRQARSGIARSGASRSNAIWPLYGVVTVDGVDLTSAIAAGSLRVTLALNEQPDTASFDLHLTDPGVQALTVPTADVVIALGGATANPIFGGRILTTQTTKRHGAVPSLRSVMVADYLQVVDSQYLITYEWPAQSATTTILDLVARFVNTPGGLQLTTTAVAANLPNHQKVSVISERFSTVLRRLTTSFPGGGGFYVDPLRGLHVWAGASEPGMTNPQPLTLANPTFKAFAETWDNSQQRDAAIVEGLRTTAPIGTPATGSPNLTSVPVLDASIVFPLDPANGYEVRIGAQRFLVGYAWGAWSAPPGTPQATVVTMDAPFDPGAAGDVTIWIGDVSIFTGRDFGWWVKVNEQYLQVLAYGPIPSPQIVVPRSGYGAQVADLVVGDVVTVVDSLAGLAVTNRYNTPGSQELTRAQPIDADVVVTVRSVTGAAIHEQIIQDGRYSRTGAAARGAREVADFHQALIAIEFETDDLNAIPGRLQAYDLPAGPTLSRMAGEYMILTAELSWPKWGDPPRRVCYATDVLAADVTDAWLVDKR